MSDGYETEELTRIEAALDALVSPTSEDVFQATRPFDERAIASVAATRGGGGGGSAPTSREEWAGNGVAIADGGGDWLPWDTSSGPDSVLDNTTPAHPTVIVAGVYLVSVVVNTAALETEGWYDAGLHMDRTGFNASMYARSSQIGTSDTLTPSNVTLSFAWYCPAGAEIGVFVDLHNPALATAKNFTLPYAHIQRLS